MAERKRRYERGLAVVLTASCRPETRYGAFVSSSAGLSSRYSCQAVISGAACVRGAEGSSVDDRRH